MILHFKITQVNFKMIISQSSFDNQYDLDKTKLSPQFYEQQ